MAVFIVDRDAHTRDSVRHFLKDMGVSVVLEAKSGDEAMRTIAQEKTRIRFIVSEEKPEGLDEKAWHAELDGRDELNVAPLLVLTSRDFLRRPTSDRVDAVLAKPFGRAALAPAMTAAYARRKRQQSTVVYFGADHAEFAALERAVTKSGHWRRAVRVGTIAEADELVRKEGNLLGAICLQPAAYAALGKDWLAGYKKTLHGMHTLLVALSRDPAAVRPLRSHCHFFVGGNEYEGLLERVATRACSGWDRECLGHQFKAAFRGKELPRAAALSRRLLALDPYHHELLCFAGDLRVKEEKRDEAPPLYRRALESNPCAPHPYIKLLELLPAGSERVAVLASAVQYCPDHPVVKSLATGGATP